MNNNDVHMNNRVLYAKFTKKDGTKEYATEKTEFQKNTKQGN